MIKQDVCKHCELLPSKCICTKVDTFFSDNWDLMYVWAGQAEHKYFYGIYVPKTSKKKGHIKKPEQEAV